MQEHFNQEIENLKTNLIRMASVVDDMVEHAIKALETGDVELCKGIKAKDLEVDAYDNLIQTQCENTLALFTPFASDLRFVMSVLMINNQLERCGDIAVNIAQRVKKTANFNSLIHESQILEEAQRAREMLKKAIDSFIHNNSELANEVLASDEAVDKLNKQNFKFLVTKMQSDSSVVEAGAHLIILTRQIERLADHATNIAENLVFFVEARVVTHYKKLNKPAKE
ncbi:MAG: phosphate signaling complex protein PhoU [Ignavibacteriales bacterium]|nr:MAG: phosphate uptake regulator PhoU [Stygiobacter sp.]KAF0214483.1 MAG: phosphate uptake regulator [Ignavibacteria bacterium]MBI3125808.1 phosphate signaling complex protein PhoU [Ignavibacteriales bacterium]OGU83867.1 MAG: phosphate transport system regulatory protein PhoU [Stygiobacter sp. RIFOXYA12_FULL_38_9]OGV06340.1 MAG: phosphate transport system regulatory protein PhoU [Stygiobacter sp. RIFOXYB2_FULL_37_11]OGV11051.1 MAG: phosphate transport system regulatory protein PhoU [Stygioba